MAIRIVNGRLYLAQYDLSGDLNVIALEATGELKDATRLTDAGHRRLAGLKQSQLEARGYWQAGVGLVDEALFTKLGLADVPLSVAVKDGVAGDNAYLFRAAIGIYEMGGQIGEVSPFRASAEGSAGEVLARGLVLHNATQTATGVGTAFNLGAIASGQTLYAALHVLTVVSGTTLSARLESDDASGFLSPTTRLTFTAQTAAGSEWKTLAGPITDAWWRVGFTISGPSPSFAFIVTAGIL